MAEYIVFKTADWPEVVRLLRCRHKWPERDLESAVDHAIEMLNASSTFTREEVAELLKEAMTTARPHPNNPGRWYYAVDCAEALAVLAKVVSGEENLSPAQRESLKEMGALSSYKPPSQSHQDTDERRAKLLLLAQEEKVLEGMKATSETPT